MSAAAGRRVLVLGGTAEAIDLAATLDRDGLRVVTSLAGRVAAPRPVAGEVRTGGFGGAEGLASWLTDRDIAAVVDATHPFAERISTSAAVACADAGVPLVRLERPGWTERPGDRWHWVADLAAAAALAPRLGCRILLTIGRQDVSAFADVHSAWFLIRCIEPPKPPHPRHHELLLERGPYNLLGEVALIERHAIDVIVTKDSGGVHTEAKLEAARLKGLPLVIVRRPPCPGVRTVADVSVAVDWVRTAVGSGPFAGRDGPTRGEPRP